MARVVEIHEMAMEQNVMRMPAVPELDLPAGKASNWPGGYHVMLLNSGPLKAGETVPITLVFEGPDKSRQTVEVKAPVRPLAGGQAPMKH